MEERKEAKCLDGDDSPQLLHFHAKHISSPCSSAMKDEYGQLDCSGEVYTAIDFELECGAVLAEAQACYNTYGRLNARRDNVIVVCHALTGNARLDQWWGDMLGKCAPHLFLCHF